MTSVRSLFELRIVLWGTKSAYPDILHTYVMYIHFTLSNHCLPIVSLYIAFTGISHNLRNCLLSIYYKTIVSVQRLNDYIWIQKNHATFLDSHKQNFPQYLMIIFKLLLIWTHSGIACQIVWDLLGPHQCWDRPNRPSATTSCVRAENHKLNRVKCSCSLLYSLLMGRAGCHDPLIWHDTNTKCECEANKQTRV